MTYGIKVSKAGYNVLTESDLNNYLFHSDYNTFKIVATGGASFTVAATTSEEKTITHSYGTRTGFIVFFEYPNGRITMMDSLVQDGSYTQISNIWGVPPVRNAANTIKFWVTNSSASTITMKYKYFLFEMPI